MSDQRPERESIWSIGRKWLPWYLGIISALTIGWNAFIAWFEGTRGENDGLSEIAIAVVKGTASAAPLIPIYALLAITALDVIGGAMVTARYMTDKFLKPLHERIRSQGREEGRSEGREQGREEERRLWAAWNQRREEAVQKGEPFDEPPPGSEGDLETKITH